MWEVCYGKEPFDLKLTVLRLIRNLGRIILITLAGTILFGGGYYVKNVLLRGEKEYSCTSIYKVEYADEPSKSGDYYINEMSWNTYIHSADFLEAAWGHLQENTIAYDSIFVKSREELSSMIQAKLDSDIHIPSTIVTSGSPAWSVLIAEAVEQTMMGEFTDDNEQIAGIHVMTPAVTAEEVIPDVRPVRAIILSAVLSCFFAVTIFLIAETGADSIWLPVTLRRRYGLASVGTLESRELKSNLNYKFKEKKKIAVCAADEDMDPAKAAAALERAMKMDGTATREMTVEMDGTVARERAAEDPKKAAVEWIPVPAPLLCGESMELLREMDGVLLVVKAGSHTGKPLEYVLEYFAEQDIEITAALLWEADELLIRAYYGLSAKKDAGLW